MIRMTMNFNALLSWNLLLPIFMYCIFAQSVMVTGSNFGSTSTMNDVDTTQRKPQGLSTRICGPGTDRCVLLGYAISTSNGATTRQLHPTEIVQTSYTVVGRETVVNPHSTVMETLRPFAKVDVKTATNKMATEITQNAINVSQSDMTVFSGNDSNITRGSDLPTAFYENRRNVNRLSANDSWELDSQSNATQSVTVRPHAILLVEEDFWQERLTKTLGIYVPLFLIITGTLGNAVSVITLQHRHFRYSSTGFILTTLSLLDIAVLNTYIMHYWLEMAFGIRILDLSRFGCKVGAALFYYVRELATWTLILLTVERTVALWFPLRCKELCSRRRIIIAWVIFAIILLLPQTIVFLAFDHLPTTVGFDDNNRTKVKYYCRPIDDYWSHLLYGPFRMYTAVMGDFIPFLVILIGNILTITRIIKSHWERKTQMGAASGSKAMASTTGMLIGITSMFLILNLPIDSVFLYYVNTDLNSLPKEKKVIYDLAYGIGILSYNANNAFEFVVYFVSGQKFRQAFLETFLPCRKTTNQNEQRTNEKRNTDTRVTSSEM